MFNGGYMGLDEKTVGELENLLEVWERDIPPEDKINHKQLAKQLNIPYREMLLARAYALIV
jgi:hypothetical protein